MERAPQRSIQRQLMLTIIGVFMLSMLTVFLVLYLTVRVSESVSVVSVEQQIIPPADVRPVDGIMVMGAGTRQTTDITALLLITGITAMTLLALFAGWFISRHAFGRLNAMRDVAAALDGDQLDARFEATERNDEIDQMAAAMNSALDRVQQGFERQRMFVRAASHELRTPLTIARTSLEVPLVEGRIPSDLQPDIEQTLAAQTRLESLLDALMTLSRAETGMATRIALDDEVREFVQITEDLFPDTDITWDLKLNPIEIDANAGVLRSVLSNLITNAVAHNNGTGLVKIGMRISDDETTIRIENTGDPLNTEEISTLLEPFTRREGSPGSGLGLAIASRAVAAMHGALHLTAREGGGLIVQLRLPGAREAP